MSLMYGTWKAKSGPADPVEADAIVQNDFGWKKHDLGGKTGIPTETRTLV